MGQLSRQSRRFRRLTVDPSVIGDNVNSILSNDFKIDSLHKT